MTKLSNEVKIAEKLKFWEEQDAINQELIPRVLKQHDMISTLTVQNEQTVHIITDLKSDLSNVKKAQLEVNQMVGNLKNAQIEKISQLEQSIQKLEEKVVQIEKSGDQPQSSSKKELILYFSVGLAVILSILNLFI